MRDAVREIVLPDEGLAPGHAEIWASTYLELADGNPSLALRIAAADAATEHQRVVELQALVSRGYARWGAPTRG